MLGRGASYQGATGQNWARKLGEGVKVKVVDDAAKEIRDKLLGFLC